MRGEGGRSGWGPPLYVHPNARNIKGVSVDKKIPPDAARSRGSGALKRSLTASCVAPALLFFALADLSVARATRMTVSAAAQISTATLDRFPR